MSTLPSDAVPVVKLPEMLPGQPSVATVRRWIRDGAGGVRLSSIKLGGRRLVSLTAAERFCEQCTTAAEPQLPPTRKREPTVRGREKQIRKSEAICEADGC